MSHAGLSCLGGGGGNRTHAAGETEARDYGTASGQKQAESSTCEEEQAPHLDKTATPSAHVSDASSRENHAHSMYETGRESLPADLQSVVDAWDALPQHARSRIVAIAKGVS